MPRMTGLLEEPEEYLENISGVVKLNTKVLSSSFADKKVEPRAVVNYSKIKKDAREVCLLSFTFV